MQITIPTERVHIDSGGTRCAGWLTMPTTPGPHPAVVLAHGLGATHDMMLATYEQRFADAGIATLAFDYRCTGDSDGVPRQHISLRDQRDDVIAAADWLRMRPGIDAGRIALWGTSLGALNVVRAAARTDIAAAIIQCPIVHGPAAVQRLGAAAVLRIAPAITADMVRRLLGRARRYIPIVGEPGTQAMVTVAGALAGWNSTVPAGGWFDNRIAASDAMALVTASALRAAREVHAPFVGLRVRPGDADGPRTRGPPCPHRPARRAQALPVRPFRDLSPAPGRHRACRPDRFPAGASRCPPLRRCATTTPAFSG